MEQAAKDTAKWTEQAAKDVGNAVRDVASSVLGKNNTLCTQACPPDTTNMGLYCASKKPVRTRKQLYQMAAKEIDSFLMVFAINHANGVVMGLDRFVFHVPVMLTRQIKFLHSM